MIDRRNVANLYPLTPLQEGMLYHALREPHARAYFEQLDFELPGPLDAGAYLQAWQDLAQRHDILRTVFAVRNLEQPLQVVLRERALSAQVQDLRGEDAARAEAAIAAWRDAEVARGFALDGGEVPLRLALFALEGGRHRVVWSFHHILLDGWSLAVLQSELDQLYAARCAGGRAALAPPVPYAGYVRWLGGRERAAGLGFWRGRLQGFRQPTPVPRRLEARFGAPEPTGARGEHRHALAPSSAEALARLAAARGVTPNLVVQSIWGLLLARQHGRRDAAFAATVSGRPPELEGGERCVGLFINAVPVRIRWDAAERYDTMLARLHAETLEGQAFHHVPLPEVQAAHPAGAALFDHVLVFENYPQAGAAGGPHAAARSVHLHEYTHYAFEAQFLPGATPTLRMRFDAGLFDAGSVAALGIAFEELLVAAADDPRQPVDALVWPPARHAVPRSAVLAASFTADPIAESVAWWLGQFACPWEIRLAPYNQCAAQLGDPASELRKADLALLAFRFADVPRDQLSVQLERMLHLLATYDGPPLVALLLPAAATDGEIEQRWAEALGRHPRVTVLDLRRLAARYALDEVFDPAADRIGHLPFSTEAAEAIAGEIARCLHARARAPFKVLALDCDNTLWSGVVGEAGPHGVRVEAGHRALQEFALGLRERGFLLALASKNHPEDVWSVFDTQPGMVLKREHIAACAIGWEAKSEGLRAIAAQLGVGVDSVVLLDDSPVECAEVMRNCQQALALVLPQRHDLFAPWLSRIWAFDQVHVTAEDRARGARMQSEARRQAALAQSPEADVLAQLQLRVRVGPVQAHQWARVAQLSQRTNQFNLSGRRRDEAQWAAFAAQPGVEVLAVEVEDRFDTYGLTGVVATRADGAVREIDTLLLSCRVLGRQVEFAVLHALCIRAAAQGATLLRAPLTPTDRNEPVQRFLAGAPWSLVRDHSFACDVADDRIPPAALALEHDAVFEPTAQAPGPAGEATIPLPAHALDAPPWPDKLPMAIVNERALRHGHQLLPLLAACAGWPRRPLRAQLRAIPAAGRAPASATEKAVAAVWSEVLGREVNDAEAGFAATGGHSLHAVRIVSRLERALGRAIGLQEFLDRGTVAAQAAWFDAAPATATAAPTTIPRAPEAEDYPLTHNQQRLWLLAQMGGAANLHNLCAAWRMRGALDVAALRRALHALAGRHAVLRTVLRARDGQPRQRILASIDVPLAVEVVDAVEAGALRARIGERCRVPFDLEDSPLWRIEVLRIAPEAHVVVLYLHHLASDGWSFGLLLRDLAALYTVETGGAATLVAAPALRYVDFASWSRSPAGEASREDDATWWRALLQPLPPIARIAPDTTPAAGASAAGARERRALPITWPDLQAWCAAHACTPFALLAAAVGLLLWRCGGAADIRLGVPAAGRSRPELEGVAGFFANTLVLPARAEPQQPFVEWAAGLQRSLAGLLAHQHQPFDRLVADLRPEREADRHPLFDVLVVLQESRDDVPSLPGLEVEDFEVDSGLAEFDLAFEFGRDAGGALACALRYRSALYRRDTAVRLLDRLEAALHAVVAQPRLPLADVPVMARDERAQLQAFVDGGRRAIPEATIGALFAAQAARTPRAVAVADATGRLDYRTLDRRANAFAARLRARGVQPGEVVAVRLERGIAWAVALLGILKAGAIYLPLEPGHPDGRVRDLVRRAQAHALGDPPGADEADDAPPAPARPDDAAYLIFTSGSTGEPKGVRVAHRAFVNMSLAQIEGFGIAPHDTVLQLASCAFDASLSECFMAWLCGARLAIASDAGRRDGAQLARELRRHEATVATFTPSHLRQLDDAQLAGLRTVVLAGEAVRGQDVRRLQALGVTVFNAYGPTETAVCATLMRVDTPPADAAAVPIGRPLPNLQLHIVDAQDRDTPIGVPGEIVVQGVGVALGYLHGDGGAFFRAGDGGPAYRTGDLGRWLPDGTVEYLGRRDAQLKIRGHRVEPAEVAAGLMALPGVQQAEVLACEGPLGAVLGAVCRGIERPTAQLLRELSDRLPAHMLPARVAWADPWPLTTSGKSDRAALAAMLAPEGVAGTDEPEELAPLEAALLTIWRACLPAAVGPRTDFFEAGGDSLAAMRAATRTARALGRPCSALQFFRTPTVRAMAAALRQPAEPVVRLGAGSIPVLALPPWPGLEAGYGALARALPQATLHVLPFTPQPLPQLLAEAVRACETLDQPPVLLGYSGGGQLALALAAALAAQGRPARSVILLDTWQWAGVSREDRAQVQAAMAAQVPAADEALAAAYLACLAQLPPGTPLRVPVHHLLAADLPSGVPVGATRDWRACAGEGYVEHCVAGAHHQLLDADHLAGTAACLGPLLAGRD